MDNYSCMQLCWLPQCTRKCVKTYKLIFKVYKIYYYRLYRICSWCGYEYDYELYPSCPCCGNSLVDDPPQAGFVLFPELLLETSPLKLFPELAFKP